MKIRASDYHDNLIMAILLICIIAVPLFYDVHLYSVFDLSKITILYILILAIVGIWSLKTLTINWKENRLSNVYDDEMKGVCGRKSFFGYNSASFHLAGPLHFPMIAFVVVTALATVFSINPFTSLLGAYKRYDGLVSTLVYVTLFYTVVHFVERKRLSLFLDVIISTAGVTAVYGVFQHFGIDFYQWSTDFGFGIRVSSTFGHPAFFSAFLIMVIPLVMVKIFSDKSNYKVGIYMAILTLLMVAFYYTKTRAAFLGLIFSLFFFFSFTGRKILFVNKIKSIVTITILIGISVSANINNKTSVIGRFTQDLQPVQTWNPNPEDREAGITDQLGGTMGMRVFQNLTALKIIRDYPVFGIGPETLGMIYPQYLSRVYKEKNVQRNFENQNRIHNDILDMAVSRGLLGLGVYVWFIFSYVRMIWKGYRKCDNKKNKILIVGLFSSCFAYFIQNQFSFGHIPILTLVWILVGFSVIACSVQGSLSNRVNGNHITGISYQQENRDVVMGRFGNLCSERFLKSVICGSIVGLTIFLVMGNLIRYKADMYFNKGRKSMSKDLTIETIESYEMAVRYNPFEINYRNVLNEIYLKMAAITLNHKRDHVASRLPESFTLEQAMLWLTHTITGAKEVQKLYPEDYRSAFTLGQAYHILGEISGKDLSKEAIKYYQQAVNFHPFKYEMHNKLALLYNEKGFHEEAIHELYEAIRFAPTNPGLYINLAKTCLKSKRYAEARKSCNQILELAGPGNSELKKYADEMLLFLSEKETAETLQVSEERDKPD
ncbi:MAG: O-antigen ligase family protein [Candidatus Scalindua sp.]|nr:O-antigen ligase family protein [Candidatus Scalindua sp.]